VAILSVPNSLKFPVLLVLPRVSSDAREGLLMSFVLGLGGLRDRFLDLFLVVRRTPESSDVDAKCFEFTGGTGGGASVGDWEERLYFDVFFRTTLGGERFPIGVAAGDAL